MRMTFVTCDAYRHCIPLALKALRVRWPTCPYPVDVVYTRTAPDVQDDGVRMVGLGRDRGWHTNMLLYLMMQAEPFILMLDDYLVVDVDEALLDTALRAIQDRRVGMVRLVPWPGPTLPWDMDGIGEIDRRAPYAMSLQAAIWKPVALRAVLERLPEDADIWDVELQGSREAAIQPYTYLGTERCAVSYQNYIRRGKVVEEVAQWFKSTI